MTRRNRLALGFAFAALVIFVVWNLMPFYFYEESTPRGIAATEIWPQVFSPSVFIRVIKSPDIDGFLEIAATLALIQSGLVVLLILPFWKMFHASGSIRVPLAMVNLAGGGVLSWMICSIGLEADRLDQVYGLITVALIALSMYCLGVAMLVFKNELLLRHGREVGETLNPKEEGVRFLGCFLISRKGAKTQREDYREGG